MSEEFLDRFLLPQFIRAIAIVDGTKDDTLKHIRAHLNATGMEAEHVKHLHNMFVKAPVDPLSAAFLPPTTSAQALIEAATPYSVVDRLRDQFFRVDLYSRTVVITDAGQSFVRGAGRAKPITAGVVESITPEMFTFVNIKVFSRELLNTMMPRADDALLVVAGQSLAETTNSAFLDPAASGIVGQSPASVTHGAAVEISMGSSTTLAVIDSKLTDLFKTRTDAQRSRDVLVTSPAVGVLLASLRGSGGAPAFPNVDLRTGGEVWGTPLILTEAARPSGSPSESFAALIDPAGIVYAEAAIRVARSGQADLQFDSDPSSDAAQLRSLWQGNLAAILVEREAAWARASASSVALLTGIQA